MNDKPKKKINPKAIILIIVVIAILIIGLVSADYLNVVNLGIFKNKLPIISNIEIYQPNEYQPSEVTFIIHAEDEDGIIVSHFIDFGDGTTSNKMSPTHTYNYGSYTATIIVTDNEGAKANDTITINVKNKKPTVSASSDINSGRNPLTITFSSYGEDEDGTIISYNWDFGDGKTSDSQNPIHIYQISGLYSAKVIVTDNNGATATDSFTINVIANSPPTAKATASKTSGYEPLTVSFSGSGTDSDGTIKTYYWNFGDGSTSDLKNPSHTFNHGTYTVILIVTDNEDATDEDILTIHVNEIPSDFTLVATDDAMIMGLTAESRNTNYYNLFEVWQMFGEQTDITYLKFDLSDIPKSATIDYVTLSLYCTYTDDETYGNEYVCIYKCTDTSWDEETITWNNAPSYDPDSLECEGVDDYLYWEGRRITWYGYSEFKNFIQESLGEEVTLVVAMLPDPDTAGSVWFESKELGQFYDRSPELYIKIEK
ncbi:MAG: PKD domain-containing protein [Candidatus Thermoplasmatota archaeon]|nr:PKD domain-containing protein [Candidatus Thermoplasmatota archaeon]